MTSRRHTARTRPILIDDPNLTPEEHHLRDLMSDISEACYSAGWLSETEFDVWRLATEGGTWGRGDATELQEELAQIMALSRQLGRWIVWFDTKGSDHQAIDLDEWKRRYHEWRTAQPPGRLG
jgi:hypothetical protein